jgi:RNA polymerase sigma-70 factor (ECF subfamily)
MPPPVFPLGHFLAALSDEHRRDVESQDELRAFAAAWLREGAAAWPGVDAEEAAFGRYVATRLPQDRPLRAALEAVRAADLFLAWGCSVGHANALAEFEASHLRELDLAWRAIAPAPLPLEDARQRLREKLFVRSAEAEPSITTYAGRGSLRHWLRVLSTRMLLDLAKRPRREVHEEDAFWDALPLVGADPQAELAKTSYRSEFKQALTEAMGALSTRERNVLRYAFVEGLTIDQIGAVYGVHRATAARRLADARTRLRTLVHQILAERLGATDREIDEMVGLLESRLDLSLERLLRPPK